MVNKSKYRFYQNLIKHLHLCVNLNNRKNMFLSYFLKSLFNQIYYYYYYYNYFKIYYIQTIYNNNFYYILYILLVFIR
jgi:hypothetical protein